MEELILEVNGGKLLLISADLTYGLNYRSLSKSAKQELTNDGFELMNGE
jgi:hypothetical protein